MKFKNVLAFGGSTVVGCELDDDPKKALNLAFPMLVANHFQVPCHNLAWSGGSNTRSMRILPESLLDYPDSLVLFNWVDFSRHEFFWVDEDYKGARDPDKAYWPLGVNWLALDLDKTLKNRIEMYYKYFYQDPGQTNNYREYNSIFYVDSACRQYSHNWIHIFESNSCLLRNADKEQQKVFQALAHNKILKFPSQIWSDKGYNCGYGNWYEWARNMAFPFGECHILHEGHEALANLIINKLQNETVSNR